MRYVQSVRHTVRVLTVGAAAVTAVVSGAAPALGISDTPQVTPAFNGAVYAVAHRGDTVYVGGSFTSATVGDRTFARQRLAAFNARTGAILNWRPGADATVRAIAIDGTSVYAAGEFGTVAGVRRDALTRLDAVSGAVRSFSHRVSGQPMALAVGNGRLYVGGRITAVGSATRRNLAAFSLTTGALDPNWKPRTDDDVHTLAVAGSKVYLGGSFHRTNDVSTSLRLTAVSGTSGVLDRGFLPKPPAAVYSIAVDAAGVYAAMGGQGGRAILYSTTGRARWTRVFDGDVQAVTVLGGVAYVGGHFDRACATVRNGPTGTCTDGSVSRIKLAAVDASGRLTGWNPAANGVVGVRVMAADTVRRTIGVGGDFTTINGAGRKRYASFR